jgi:hypothetical protein
MPLQKDQFPSTLNASVLVSHARHEKPVVERAGVATHCSLVRCTAIDEIENSFWQMPTRQETQIGNRLGAFERTLHSLHGVRSIMCLCYAGFKPKDVRHWSNHSH